ncbi:MAG: hypothetical protein BGO63_07815 [Candidatus Accumulibacter sp. 66-26]|nr:MAG: hypothetical protein BGO63_07815 [Candidatus Accumulibacter sp. 66-26]
MLGGSEGPFFTQVGTTLAAQQGVPLPTYRLAAGSALIDKPDAVPSADVVEKDLPAGPPGGILGQTVRTEARMAEIPDTAFMAHSFCNLADLPMQIRIECRVWQ